MATPQAADASRSHQPSPCKEALLIHSLSGTAPWTTLNSAATSMVTSMVTSAAITWSCGWHANVIGGSGTGRRIVYAPGSFLVVVSSLSFFRWDIFEKFMDLF